MTADKKLYKVIITIENSKGVRNMFDHMFLDKGEAAEFSRRMTRMIGTVGKYDDRIASVERDSYTVTAFGDAASAFRYISTVASI